MKVLIVCAVFSVILAVSLAGPVKIHVRDVADTSSASNSEESVEVKNVDKSLSSEENANDEKEEVLGNKIIQINKEEDSSSESVEETTINSNKIVRDPVEETSSSEEHDIQPRTERLIIVNVIVKIYITNRRDHYMSLALSIQVTI